MYSFNREKPKHNSIASFSMKRPQETNMWVQYRKVRKRIAVCTTSTAPLRELTCHMGSHSVTCHPAEVTFPPLPQPIKAGTRFICVASTLSEHTLFISAQIIIEIAVFVNLLTVYWFVFTHLRDENVATTICVMWNEHKGPAGSRREMSPRPDGMPT